MDRKLCGVYFRVKRNGKWQSACFSDMTEEEIDAVLNNKSSADLKNLCKVLANSFKRLGETLDIVRDDNMGIVSILKKER